MSQKLNVISSLAIKCTFPDFSIFLLLLLNFSSAQIADSSSIDSLSSSIHVYKAEPIIINATRSAQPILQTPYAVESFEIDGIQNAQKLISLEETLQSVPGLFVNNRSNFALGDRISIRGIGARSSFGVRGIKILLDDIPLTMPDGQSQLNNLDLGSAGKIEIIKGASSSLYGNASGGVINIQSEDASTKLIQFEPQITLGSHDLLRLQSKLSGTHGKSNYLVNVNKFKSSGFRENSAVEYWSVNAINRYIVSEEFKITGLINYYSSPYSLNPSSLSREDAENNRSSSRYFVKQQGSAEKISQGQAGLTFNYKPSLTDQLKITIYGVDRSLKNPIPSRIIELDRLAGGLRMYYSSVSIIENLKLNWTAGIDAEIQSDKRQEYANQGLSSELVGNIKSADILNNVAYGDKLQNQDEQVFGFGPFINLNVPFSTQWIFTFGSRFDQYSFKVDDHFVADSSDDTGNIKMQQFSPMIGITYMFSPTQSLYVNYSTAFQTPTTSELGNSPLGAGGLNPNLQPETIKNFEFGIKGILADLNLYHQTVVYYLQINDMLIPYQNDLSEEVFYRNAGRAQNFGIEFSLDWRIHNAISFQLSYSYMDFKFSDYKVADPSLVIGETINLKNNKIPGVAPQRFYSSILYNHTSKFFTMIQFNWIDKYFADDFNGKLAENSTPRKDYINKAYSSLNIRLGKTWQFSQLAIQFFSGIDNLLNEHYNGSIVPNARNNNFFEPAPGRTWYSGIKLIL